MKKLTAMLLIIMLCLSIMPFAVSAAENKIVWSEDFNNVKTFEELNWPKMEMSSQNTASYSIADGKLLIDNLASGAKDSYILVVPETVMGSVVSGDYTVQFELSYLDSGDTQRYMSLLTNYDTVTGENYNSVMLRMRGNGNFRALINGSWQTVEPSVDKGLPTLLNTDSNSLSEKVFGLPYSADAKVLQGLKMVVRYEIHKGKKVDVFVNDILVTTTDDSLYMNYLANEAYSAIALKAGTTIKATVDNIVVATGIGLPASEQTTTTTTTTTQTANNANTSTTSSTTKATSSPTTSDSIALPIIVFMISFAGIVTLVQLKRKTGSEL